MVITPNVVNYIVVCLYLFIGSFAMHMLLSYKPVNLFINNLRIKISPLKACLLSVFISGFFTQNQIDFISVHQIFKGAGYYLLIIAVLHFTQNH